MSAPTPSTSTFKTAVPYGILALGVGAAGAAVGLACTATALKIIGVVLGVIGVYSFFAVLTCGFLNAGQPEKFKEQLHKHVVTSVGIGIANIINSVVRETISVAFDQITGRQTTSFRRSHL